MKVHHLNCVEIQSPTGDRAIGHCILIQMKKQLILVDAGISSQDLVDPNLHFTEVLIQQVGFNFRAFQSAKDQILNLGLNPLDVTDIVLSHLDCDHSSGLLDFPKAKIHVAQEELTSFYKPEARYLDFVLQHRPLIQTYGPSTDTWLGFEARYLALHPDLSLALIPLFGHTLGHCGVAFTIEKQTYFYVGDAYYLRAELTDPLHPVHELTKARAADNIQRLFNLERLKVFVVDHPEICVFGYHDAEEWDNCRNT